MFICFFLFQSLKKIIDLTKLFHYTGWPRENATLTINNLKKKRDRMKKLCALLRIKFFSRHVAGKRRFYALMHSLICFSP